MKAEFRDFLREHPTCANAAEDAAAQAVFDLLSQDPNLIAMIDASEMGRPALTPCVQQIEAYLDSLPNPAFDVKNPTARQTIGCMVKTILWPFGYRVTKQKSLPKGIGRYFVSASCYALSAPEAATMRVVKRVEAL